MKRTISLLLACVLCLFCFAGCGSKTSSDGKNEEASAALNIALDGEPSNLDIAMSTEDIASVVAYGSIYEQLVALNADNEVVCELCENFDVNDDNTVYTYHLRQGVLFHNGEEMTADDVVASMNRWIDNAENANTLVGGAHFYKVDDYTVEITMENGTLYLNEMIGGLGQHAVIMPASVIEAVGEGELVTDYIGTGPYVFLSLIHI